VLYVEEESGSTARYVLLTDLEEPQVADVIPLMGAVPLAQKALPSTVLYPSVSGSLATGLAGTWRARADRLMSIYAKRFRAAGVVTPEELLSIEAAARAFLGLYDESLG
jgi:hypothetical protein